MDDRTHRRHLEAEVTEELAHRHAQKRPRLEEAAKRPSESWYVWAYYGTVCGLLLYFNEHSGRYIWLVALYLLIEMKSSAAAVHNRIDAILELENARRGAQREEETKIAEQFPSSDGDKPAL